MRWLQKLSEMTGVSEVPAFSSDAHADLEKIISNFSVDQALQVKAIERTTNHDVKAIEYFLKDHLGEHPEVSKVPQKAFNIHLRNLRLICFVSICCLYLCKSKLSL